MPPHRAPFFFVSAMRRTLVVADVHLTRQTPRPVAADLARLFTEHPGARVYVAGDLFDRSAEAAPTPSVDEVLGAHPGLARALGEHLERGGELRLAAGNHDADVGREGFGDTLARALRLGPEARGRLSTTPWFFRDGSLHLEHGHVFDPDNAPGHPLVHGAPSLGVRFVHDFIAPTGAYAYLNRNDKLPLELFTEAFTRYGARGPHVVATFFRASFAALANAGPFYDLDAERASGDALLDAFALGADVSADALRGLLSAQEAPTLARLGGTFARLYLDRVAFTMALLSSLGLAASGRRRAALALAAVGMGCMLSSWAAGYNRYAGRVVTRLAAGAELVAGATGASLVVLGHAHSPEVTDGYANPGTFSFSPGETRTFLELHQAGDRVTAALRALPKSA